MEYVYKHILIIKILTCPRSGSLLSAKKLTSRAPAPSLLAARTTKKEKYRFQLCDHHQEDNKETRKGNSRKKKQMRFEAPGISDKDFRKRRKIEKREEVSGHCATEGNSDSQGRLDPYSAPQ
jgi:hypothetical protein